MFTLGANSVVLFYMVSGYIFYSITIHICLETVEVSSLSKSCSRKSRRRMFNYCYNYE